MFAIITTNNSNMNTCGIWIFGQQYNNVAYYGATHIPGAMTAQHSLSSCYLNTKTLKTNFVMGSVATCL